MWHASAAKQGALGPLAVWIYERELWDVVQRALDGVGDPALGEWRETTRSAVHLRRRLRDDEWGGRPWGMDLRNTAEGYERLAPVRQLLPPGWMA